MSLPTVTCPNCNTLLRSSRPIPAGSSLRCPECQTGFTANPPALPPPLPVLTRPAAPSLFGPPLIIAATVSVVLGGAIIVAAVIFSKSTPQPQKQAEEKKPVDDGKSKAIIDREKKLKADREELQRERDKIKATGLVNKGELLLARNQFKEAEALFKQARKLAPDDEDAVKGLVAAQSGLKLADRSRTDDKKRDTEVQKLVKQGEDQMDKKQFAQAVRSYESARQLDPTNEAIKKALAKAQDAADADTAAKKTLTDYKTAMDTAKKHMDNEQFADAVKEYLIAQKLVPNDPDAVDGQKKAEGKIANLADAKKRRAAFDNLLDRAKVARVNKKYNEALQGIAAALRLIPKDREALAEQAAALADLKKTKAANAKLIEQGDAAMKLGLYDDAQKAYDEAVKNWAEDSAAAQALKKVETIIETARTAQLAYVRYMQAGALALDDLRYADAVVAYVEALKLFPLDVQAKKGLIVARVGLDRVLKVKVAYDRQIMLGTAAMARRSYADAITAYAEALKLVPNDIKATAGYNLARYHKAIIDGQVFLRSKQKQKAIKAFELALDLKPGDVLARNGLATAKGLR